MRLFRKRSVWKGAVAGLVGGFVGCWTMNRFQELLSKVKDSGQQGSQDREAQPEQEPATVKAAEKVTLTVLHRDLRPKEKQIAEPLVHYGYGTLMGGIYGALGQKVRRTSIAGGLPFAAALWLGGDEIAVPALGLSKDPREYPLASHAEALAAHLVYGVSTDAVRRAVLKALD